MTRYFQNIDPTHREFQSVVELADIEDYGDMVFYVFNNGDKCNKSFIADLNDFNAYGHKLYAEISSPYNKYVFERNKAINNQAIFDTDANQERFEIPNPYDNGKKNPFKDYTIKQQPTYINPATIKTNETPINNTQIENKPVINQPQNKEDIKEDKPSELPTCCDNRNDAGINSGCEAPITVYEKESGETLIITFDTIKQIINIAKSMQQHASNETKISEATSSELKYDDNNDLIKGLIKNTKKESYSINISLDITLPPTLVYKTIKETMSDTALDNFFHIIAQGIDTESIKKSLEDGLKTLYEDGALERANKD